MSNDVRVELHHTEIARLAESNEMRGYLLDATKPGTQAARSAAPTRTGAGAGSIHAEAVLDGAQWTARVSWDQVHYYMRFHETGTKHLPARPFLVPSFT